MPVPPFSVVALSLPFLPPPFYSEASPVVKYQQIFHAWMEGQWCREIKAPAQPELPRHKKVTGPLYRGTFLSQVELFLYWNFFIDDRIWNWLNLSKIFPETILPLILLSSVIVVSSWFLQPDPIRSPWSLFSAHTTTTAKHATVRHVLSLALLSKCEKSSTICLKYQVAQLSWIR